MTYSSCRGKATLVAPEGMKSESFFVEEEIMFRSFKGRGFWGVVVVGVAGVFAGTREANAQVGCQFICAPDEVVGGGAALTQESCLQQCKDPNNVFHRNCPDPNDRSCRWNGALIWPPPSTVPAVGEWGMAILMLSVLAGISLKFRGRVAPGSQ